MKIEIETYKGQEIFYDDNLDKFTCEISIEDYYKSTKRQSLTDVRKEIDLFVKKNADFVPFKFLEISEYGRDSFKVMTALSIRTDGKIIVGESGGYKRHFDAKDIKRMMKYDQSIVDELAQADKELKEANKKHSEKENELIKRLTPVNLDKYKHLIEPPATN